VSVFIVAASEEVLPLYNAMAVLGNFVDARCHLRVVTFTQARIYSVLESFGAAFPSILPFTDQGDMRPSLVACKGCLQVFGIAVTPWPSAGDRASILPGIPMS